MGSRPSRSFVQNQAQQNIEVKITVNPDYGLELQFPDPSVQAATQSPTWNFFRWKFFFVNLAPFTTFPVLEIKEGERHYVKPIQGKLINIENGNTVTNPHSRRNLVIPRGVSYVKSGDNGAFFAYLISQPESVQVIINNMKDTIINEIKGPHSDVFAWKLYSTIDPSFKGVEFYNLRGFRLLDFNGNRIGYVQFWTLGSGDDAGYHDHHDLDAQTAFCEIHYTLYNGTGHGGMQFMDNSLPISPLIPMPQGYEHGPLWYLDYTTGIPTVDPSNGAIKYPLHRWIAGGIKGVTPLVYDVWVAFEMLPQNSVVPQDYLTQLVPDREVKKVN